MPPKGTKRVKKDDDVGESTPKAKAKAKAKPPARPNKRAKNENTEDGEQQDHTENESVNDDKAVSSQPAMSRSRKIPNAVVTVTPPDPNAKPVPSMQSSLLDHVVYKKRPNEDEDKSKAQTQSEASLCVCELVIQFVCCILRAQSAQRT